MALRKCRRFDSSGLPSSSDKFLRNRWHSAQVLSWTPRKMSKDFVINTHVIPTVKENINSAYMKDVYFANAAKGNKIFFSLKG